MVAGLNMKQHMARRDRARADRVVWDPIYNQAYDYCVPYRRPKSGMGGEERIAHIFDPTAIVSTFRGAGKLQQDLFPPGQPLFKLRPGHVLKQQAKQDGELDNVNLQFDSLTNQLRPFFSTGEWDTVTAELCLELFIGTGVVIPVMGDARRPVRFMCVPADECAFAAGAFGDIDGLFWTQKQSYQAIYDQFNGYDGAKWPDEFTKNLKDNPSDLTELRQDFVRKDKGWAMIVHVEATGDDVAPVVVQETRQKPFAAVRYHRVPGETMGRGPALLALPFARTLNKAMEITLKSSAIQMLGIWGYRPGSTFNPEQVKLAPGQFWPVTATGGVMGADVTRLDTSSGRLDVANIVLQELRTQVQQALHDERLPNEFGTPKSAAEIMARMAQVKADYIGAHGRMINELVPVIIPRVAEILHKQKLLDVEVPIDELLISVEVLSPLAQTLKAERWKPLLDSMQLVQMLSGPEAIPRHFDIDQIIHDMVLDLGSDSVYVHTLEAIAKRDAEAAQQQAAMMAAQAALDKPQEMANVAMQAEGEPAPDPGAEEVVI